MAARAAGSSLMSMILRVVSRLTTASAIRSAISSRRGIPEESTSARRGVSRKRGQRDRHPGARAGSRVGTDAATVRLHERFHHREPEARAGTERRGVAHAIVGLEDARALVGGNARPLVLHV